MEATPSESRCLLCHLVGLTCAQAALGRRRWAACLGRFRPLGSVLERPRLSLFLMIIGKEGESLEPLASLLSGRGFPRALGSLCFDPSFQCVTAITMGQSRVSPRSLTFPISGADLLLVSVIHFPWGGRFYETLVSSTELAGGCALPAG